MSKIQAIKELNIWAVLENIHTKEKRLIKGRNIVTNSGDRYYAQMGCGESPTDDFDGASSGIRLGSGTATPTKTDTDVTTFISGSLHTMDTGYEKTNDTDGDNTGAGVDIVTWRYSWVATDGPYANIYEGAIVDNRTTPTRALTHFLFSATFSKTTSDTLRQNLGVYKFGYMRETLGYSVIPKCKNVLMQTIRRKDSKTFENPHRPYAEYLCATGKDMVGSLWRHREVAGIKTSNLLISTI